MTILPGMMVLERGMRLQVETVEDFTAEIPTIPGFFWCYSGLDADYFTFEIVRVEKGYYSEKYLFKFSHKTDYLDLSEVKEEFLKEDKGLFGPRIAAPTIRTFSQNKKALEKFNKGTR